jgi:riboflavin kinase / FMN adenylyltransferase
MVRARIAFYDPLTHPAWSAIMNSMKQGCVISIGVFDGVHRGHRRVLKMLRETAEHLGLPAVVVTFDPHPRRVLQPDKAPPMLVSVQRRLELLASTGCVDHTFVMPFDQRRREQAADDFVRHTLIERLGMRALVVGENFVCGKARAGTVEYLERLGMSANFSVHPVPLHTAFDDLSAEPASSTVIRRLIREGDVRSSARLLGRYHELECNVGPRGELFLPAGMCVPRDGRYAVLLCSRHGVTLPASVNIQGDGDRHRCFAQYADFETDTHVTVQFVDVIKTVRQVQVSV